MPNKRFVLKKDDKGHSYWEMPYDLGVAWSKGFIGVSKGKEVLYELFKLAISDTGYQFNVSTTVSLDNETIWELFVVNSKQPILGGVIPSHLKRKDAMDFGMNAWDELQENATDILRNYIDKVAVMEFNREL